MNAWNWILAHWGTLIIVLTTGWIGNAISSAIFQWAGAQTKTGPVWAIIRFIHGILNRIDAEESSKPVAKTLGSLLFILPLLVVLGMAGHVVTACHGWVPVGGTAAIGGAVATGGSAATGGNLATGGSAPSPTPEQDAGAQSTEPEFPVCMATETGGLEWSIPVDRSLGWHKNPQPNTKRFAPMVAAVAIHSVSWAPNDIWNPDQGDVGKCVGFGWENCLSTQPFAGNFSNEQGDAIYHQATILDSFKGTYPPDDTGSTVFAGGQAAVYLNRIKGFEVAYTVDEMLQRLMVGPGVVGTDWRQGMMTTDNCGHLNVSGPVVGGHARAVVAYDAPRQRVWELGSWGKFGVKNKAGRYGFQYMNVAEFKKLFTNGGEAYFPKLN